MMAPETVVTVDHSKPTSPQAPPQQQGNAISWIKVNIDYFKTPPGILKIVQLIFGILCMALCNFSSWFIFVAITSFITTLIWSLVFFLSIKEALRLPINWTLSELISVAIETVFYLIAVIVLFVAVNSYYLSAATHASNTAAAVFGLFNTFAYAGSAYFLFMEHKTSTSGTA